MSCSPLVILGMWIVVLKVSNMPISCRTSFLLVVPRISNFRPCSINTSNEFVYHLWYFLKQKGQNFSLANFCEDFMQPCYGAYVRGVKRWAIPRGPREQRGLWVTPCGAQYMLVHADEVPHRQRACQVPALSQNLFIDSPKTRLPAECCSMQA